MDTDLEREGMTDTSIRVSEELADELYQRKGRSTSYEDYIWELLEQVEERESDEDIAESDSSEGTDTLDREGGQTASAPEEQVYGERAELVESDKETQAAEGTLRSLNLPGEGVKYETRVNAVLTFYEYLHDHQGEPVSKGDLKELAEDTSLDIGYASFTSFWNNWVKSNASQGRNFNTLEELPNIEMQGDDYVYTGDDDE